jgi:hypothetical protein
MVETTRFKIALRIELSDSLNISVGRREAEIPWFNNAMLRMDRNEQQNYQEMRGF